MPDQPAPRGDKIKTASLRLRRLEYLRGELDRFVADWIGGDDAPPGAREGIWAALEHIDDVAAKLRRRARKPGRPDAAAGEPDGGGG